MNPLQIFRDWYAQELAKTKVRIPSACCLSTVGLDTYPNARFVSLKEVLENGLVVTGSLDSLKGQEIRQNPQVALTFWWVETERQVRIQGEAKPISSSLADHYFSERSRDSQIVSWVSKQGENLTDLDLLHQEYEKMEKNSQNQTILRPENWGGYVITPFRIEFMEFKPNRFHDRKLYESINHEWILRPLQP